MNLGAVCEFGSKVRPITFGCVAMCSVRSAVYSDVLIVRIFRRVWSEQSASCYVWI